MNAPNLALDLVSAVANWKALEVTLIEGLPQDTFFLEYKVQTLVLVDTVSIQILAVESVPGEDSHSDAGTSGSSPELIRLEVGSVGPVELSSKIEMFGYDAIDDAKARYTPHLDLESNRGEHSFLLRHVEVELWRVRRSRGMPSEWVVSSVRGMRTVPFRVERRRWCTEVWPVGRRVDRRRSYESHFE